MKSFIILVILSITICSLFAQENMKPAQIKIVFGRSIHGTGDMGGLAFSTEFQKFFKPRLTWSLSLDGSIHSRDFPIFFNSATNPNQIIDGSIRSTTAGVQVAGHLGYNILKSKQQDFQCRIGALLRYQSSSYYDGVQVLYPPLTGLPIPVNVFDNTTPQNTYAVGGSIQLLYNYTLKNDLTIGPLVGFQIDTNGDALSQISLTIGKRF